CGVWGGERMGVGAQMGMGWQTIKSRQVDVTGDPSVLTVGIFNSGNRSNIVPERAQLEGTLRTFSPETREFIMRRMKETAEGIARSAGGEATIEWIGEGYIPLVNDAALTRRMLPTLQRVAGAEKVFELPRRTPAEDFSFFSQQIPGMYFNVGIIPAGVPMIAAAPNHSPRFMLDEAGLLTGLRAMVHVTFDY